MNHEMYTVSSRAFYFSMDRGDIVVRLQKGMNLKTLITARKVEFRQGLEYFKI